MSQHCYHNSNSTFYTWDTLYGEMTANYFRIQKSTERQNNAIQYFRYTQRSCWRFKSSGMLHCVARWVVPSIWKDHSACLHLQGLVELNSLALLILIFLNLQMHHTVTSLQKCTMQNLWLYWPWWWRDHDPLKNIKNYLTSNTLAHPRRLESSMRKHHTQHSQIFTTSAYHYSAGFLAGYLLSNFGECLHRTATKILNTFYVVTRSILLGLCNSLVWNHTQNFCRKLQITAKYCI